MNCNKEEWISQSKAKTQTKYNYKSYNTRQTKLAKHTSRIQIPKYVFKVIFGNDSRMIKITLDIFKITPKYVFNNSKSILMI